MAKKFNFSPSNSDTKEKAKKGKEKQGKRMSTFMEKLGNHLSKGK